MWHAGHAMGWWMLFGGLLWIAFVAAAIYLFASFFRVGPQAPRDEAPIEVAKRRYAGGEIDKAEFERIRQDLAASS